MTVSIFIILRNEYYDNIMLGDKGYRSSEEFL